MYREFKKRLLGEMEMKRDMIVLKYSEPSIEPIFEVSSFDDKLYNRILREFDMIAVRYSEELLYNLCIKHGVKVKKAGEGAMFDLLITVEGQDCYVELKNSPLAFTSSMTERFLRQVRMCDQPVYLVYLLKDSEESRNAIMQKHANMQDTLAANNLESILFEDYLFELFGINELKLFKDAMRTYKDEMHQAVGHQITEIFNDHNLERLKHELKDELRSFPYDHVRSDGYIEPHERAPSFNDISEADYANIKMQFINDRYMLLLGRGDYAKSFLTSEWLYKKYFMLPEMDNTFIVSGYLKSIEQLLWNIISIIGQGRKIKRRGNQKLVEVNENNEKNIDTTLFSLQSFITNSKNADLFEPAFGTRTIPVMEYLNKQLNDWRVKYRNGYFHKHNLEDKETIEGIRNKTVFLHMLLLGSLLLKEDVILLLS